ncbi:hypothetical protein L209DRAFT_758098 [Thermothelomyces heterothallicus CBS 203.75]
MVPAATYAHHSGIGMGMFQAAIFPHQQYMEQAQPLKPAAPTPPTSVVMKRARRLEEVGSSSVNVIDSCEENDDGFSLGHREGKRDNGVSAVEEKEQEESQSDGTMEQRYELQAEGRVGDEEGQSISIDGSRNGWMSEAEAFRTMEDLEWEEPTELGGGMEGGLRYPRYSRRAQSKSEPVMVGTVRQSSLGERLSEFGC